MPATAFSVETINQTVGVHNPEFAYNTEGPVTGDIARRLGEEICSRWVWPNFDKLFIPTHPGEGFRQYAASLGRSPQIIVPQGVNTKKLSMRDGFPDLAFQQAMQDAEVVSFVPDPLLGAFAERHRGSYYWGTAGNAADLDNKVNFRDLTQELRKLKLIGVPEGVAMNGIHRIAGKVRQRLNRSGNTYVRHATLGGGFGNRLFDKSNGMPSLAEIETKLRGTQPELWESADALIEEYCHFRHLPAVTFDARKGFEFDDLQIVRGGSYKGMWAPTPGRICSPGQLADIGNMSAAVANKYGYVGTGNMDLGILFNGKRLGLEFNMRKTAATHVQALGELMLGPFNTWREEKYAVKSLDAFYLGDTYTFPQLHDALDKMQLLATPKNPFGVVISIPPSPDGKVAGIQIQARGHQSSPDPYRNAERIYQQVLDSVGDRTANKHFNPLF